MSIATGVDHERPSKMQHAGVQPYFQSLEGENSACTSVLLEAVHRSCSSSSTASV